MRRRASGKRASGQSHMKLEPQRKVINHGAANTHLAYASVPHELFSFTQPDAAFANRQSGRTRRRFSKPPKPHHAPRNATADAGRARGG